MTTEHTPDAEPQPQQLALLPRTESVPLQLRLSQRARRVGLAGIAQARAILAEQAARRQEHDERVEHLPERAA